IDLEAAAGLELEKGAITAVADQALVAPAQRYCASGADGLALCGVLVGFGLVATDDRAAEPGFAIAVNAGADELLDEKIGGAAPGRFGDAQRHMGGGSAITPRISLVAGSRPPRISSMLRASSSARVAALIMPRSAPMPMRAIMKRILRRSITGTSVVTS